MYLHGHNNLFILKTTLLYRYRFAILWALFILFACGASPGTLTNLRLEDLFTYDKPIHALLFGTQAWLLIRAGIGHTLPNRHKSLIWLCCSISALYGAGIELMQKWVFVGRSYDYFDLAANVTGCIIALLFALRKYTPYHV